MRVNMVKKRATRVKPAHKQVTLKKHHAKPYRKRHIGVLVIFIAAILLLLGLLFQYRDQVITGLASSRGFVGSLFDQQKSYDLTIKSSNGFELTFDQKVLNGSAISGSTGSLFIGAELGQTRDYNVVRISPTFTEQSTELSNRSALTMTYHNEKLSNNAPLSSIALQDGGLDIAQLNRTKQETVKLGGQSFDKSTWQSKEATGLLAGFSAKFVTYSALVNDHAVTIVIALGLDASAEAQYNNVLGTLKFGNSLTAYTAPSSAAVAKAAQSKSLLDILMNTQLASAATKTASYNSEQVAALYSPAVVKVFNAYCMDVAVDGKPFIKEACSAGAGSAFFVSGDGYLATNGHVVAINPIDIAISNAVAQYTVKNEPKYLQALLTITTLKPSDIPAGATKVQALAMMVDALYELDESRFTASNDVSNMLINVTSTQLDVQGLLTKTKARQQFTDTNALPAKLVADDYRVVDGYDGFKASDVAIIKVEGSNYPVVTIGSIGAVTQGANLSILGFPGNATNNGIVESTSTEATLTTGKVSAKKKASGSDKMLIETDTTIGHGNSGGPVLADDGTVVGIATYTADGSGSGDGVFNYIRDIKDLVDLAEDKSVKINNTSETQVEWNEGIDNYYSSHYSKAVKNFKAVEALYPNHSRVAEFIASAEKKIANGEDVKDFPVIPVVIALVVLLIGAGATVFVIVRHNKKHRIYQAGVVQGTVNPVVPGQTAPQVVNATQVAPVVSTPVQDVELTSTPPVVPPTPPTAPTAPAPVTPPTQPPASSEASNNPWFNSGNTPSDTQK